MAKDMTAGELIDALKQLDAVGDGLTIVEVVTPSGDVKRIKYVSYSVVTGGITIHV